MILRSHPATSAIPEPVLVEAQKRLGYLLPFYQRQGLEMADLVADLFIAWVEHKTDDPAKIVARLNSRMRREVVEDNITRSAMAADAFFDGFKRATEENEATAAEEDEWQDLYSRLQAESEADKIWEFATQKMGLKPRTVGDYLTRDPAAFLQRVKTEMRAIQSRLFSADGLAVTAMEKRGRPRNGSKTRPAIPQTPGPRPQQMVLF